MKIIPTNARGDANPFRWAQQVARQGAIDQKAGQDAEDRAIYTILRDEISQRNTANNQQFQLGLAENRNTEWDRRYGIRRADALQDQQNRADTDLLGGDYTPRRYNTGQPNDIVNEIIRQANERGMDPGIALAIAKHESGFRNIPTSVPGQSAFGPFQIIKATWEGSGGGPKRGVIAEEVRVGLNLVQGYNRKFQSRFGRAPKPHETYLMHFLGSGTKALGADLNAPISSVMSPAQIKANSFARKFRTVGDLHRWAARAMNSGLNAVKQFSGGRSPKPDNGEPDQYGPQEDGTINARGSSINKQRASELGVPVTVGSDGQPVYKLTEEQAQDPQLFIRPVKEKEPKPPKENIYGEQPDGSFNVRGNTINIQRANELGIQRSIDKNGYPVYNVPKELAQDPKLFTKQRRTSASNTSTVDQILGGQQEPQAAPQTPQTEHDAPNPNKQRRFNQTTQANPATEDPQSNDVVDRQNEVSSTINRINDIVKKPDRRKQQFMQSYIAAGKQYGTEKYPPALAEQAWQKFVEKSKGN